MSTTLRRILLVEDSLNDIMLAKAAMEEIHLLNQLDVVRDGVEALDYLFCRGNYVERSPENPLVVMLDLKMPRLGGLEVLEEIRRHERFLGMPVVMLTSSREESDLVSSYRLGVNAFVVKPVDFEQFNEVVRSLGLFWGVFNKAPGELTR